MAIALRVAPKAQSQSAILPIDRTLAWLLTLRSPKTNMPACAGTLILEEKEGFEPSVRQNRTPDFESGPFDHSGTSPGLKTCCRSINPLPVIADMQDMPR